jgi:outer membrane protein assembly factor BamB
MDTGRVGTADEIGGRLSAGRLRSVPAVVACVLATVVVGKAVRPVLAEAIDHQRATVTGVVYDDRDGDDERDAGEPGAPGVSVSDGVTTVRTDEAGRYSLDVDIARRLSDLVFITKPAGWEVPPDQYMTPRFYRDLGQLQDGQGGSADFAMLRNPRGRADDFTFANVADPHINADFANQVRQINATSQDLAFVQVSGDLTNFATDAEFERYKAGTAVSELPVWPAVGNHEYFNDGDRTYAGRIDNYRRHLGPEWYSFDHGDRHFLVLDNNGAAPFDEQRAWVEQDLATNARGKRVVILTHQPMNVPFGSPSSYDEYVDLFERYDAELVLVGHEHSNDVDPTWLGGAKHVQTNSGSNTIDHSPRGFRYVHMRGERFTNPFRMYGADHELTITHPAPGARVADLDEVQVNAYTTSDEVRDVRYRLDDGAWRPLRRSGDFTWFGAVTTQTAPRAHTVEVEAVDQGGRRWRESATFKVTRGDPPVPRAGADWAQFHGDASHSGVAADELGSDLELAWTHRSGGTIATGSPVVAEGVAYIGVRDENGTERWGVHAIDLESGRTLWRLRTDSSVHGTPAVADGLVFAPSLRGTLYGIDARTGELRWKREAERPEPPLKRRSYSYYSPAVAGGRVYWAYQTRHGKASSGLLIALEPKTGAAIWETPMTGNRMSDGTPAIADGRIYVGEQLTDRVVAYDAATGQRLWVSSTNPDGGSQDAAPTAAAGRVFIGYGSAVIARDAATGAEQWVHRSPGPGWGDSTAAAPAVAGSTLYMGFPDGRVTALDVASGAVVWSVRLPGRPYHGGVLSSPAVSGNTIYVGSNDGHLYGLDRSTGAERFKYEIGPWVASGPAITGNTLLAGAWDGNLYAFTEKE